ncbi:hypothetical protein B0T18DRAFT_397081 [Schizothecium vesticola]|uniref:Uncharacterized protein n=1 Tax=Schizothecium vesticola TaxID=314040 RepID=A0AA40F970_9PEZI|nr:hypothetical protein B0T18DRAFT_397081 [Schizothecium vesticola]
MGYGLTGHGAWPGEVWGTSRWAPGHARRSKASDDRLHHQQHHHWNIAYSASR